MQTEMTLGQLEGLRPTDLYWQEPPDEFFLSCLTHRPPICFVFIISKRTFALKRQILRHWELFRNRVTFADPDLLDTTERLFYQRKVQSYVSEVFSSWVMNVIYSSGIKIPAADLRFAGNAGRKLSLNVVVTILFIGFFNFSCCKHK